MNNNQDWEDIRSAAEQDLWFFARLINPQYLYGDIHKEVFRHMMDDSMPNSLVLLPRAHLKSHVIAVWCAWWITKHPETSILYLSATTSLAEDQLYAIKNMLTSEIYSFYWPGMVDTEEGKRETWTKSKIAVDHPKRKEEATRDMTVIAAGLTTGTTGKHADIIVPDDVVVPGNAYTEEGRRQVAAAMSQMSSILNTGGMVKACGTRYHPNDQYALWKEMVMPTFDENGYEDGKEPIWNIFERVVEKQGVFLWPRAVREDGKAFGFDRRELARISAMYTDRTQFYAQYYNDPNDPESNRVSPDSFQYYERGFVKQEQGNWYFKDKRLNIFAGIDFAYTIKDKSDYTAIIVIGVDCDNNIYILDIDRFKTDKIQEYYDRLMVLYFRWEFKKLRAEITAAQSIIVNDLKDRFRKAGTYITVEGHRPTSGQGSKEERIAAVLEPRYQQGLIFHYKGGFTPALEEEIVLARPKFDDLKDCLASVVETATPPRGRSKYKKKSNKYRPTSRFGG